MLTSDMQELAKLAAISDVDEVVEEKCAENDVECGPGISSNAEKLVYFRLLQNYARESCPNKHPKTKIVLASKTRTRRYS